jgi:xylan 1,4-beta-xylosidase
MSHNGNVRQENVICQSRNSARCCRRRRGITRILLVFTSLVSIRVFGQKEISISVDSSQLIGTFKSIYAYFGYDEANYTYTNNGAKLVGELGALSKAPTYIRTHFLLATGSESGGMKWGATNVYTEDAEGKAVYDWKIIDRIFDTYLRARAKPFVEIGFMPQALSSNPLPYQVPWVPGGANRDYASGWSYPPRDYRKWEDLIYEWVRHCLERYGPKEVESWYWEVWNEPDIFYWHGSAEQYDKLYDYTAAGLKRALPSAKIGGPAVTGPSGREAAAFLTQFLEHCDHGLNFASSRTGAALDFISYHAKGRASVVDGSVRMGIAKHAQDVDQGLQIIHSFAKFRQLPIVLSESDPEGCAACSARLYPQNAYRNGTLYPAYTAVMLKNILELADRQRVDVVGMLTWAFEFDGQRYFDGFRTLSTNGIDKPVLNLFRMLGLMQGNRIKIESSGRVPLATMLTQGAREPDVDGLAVARDREVSILIWNYRDESSVYSPAKVRLVVAGFPGDTKRVLLRQYRIDEDHNNSWAAWKKMGSPPSLSPQQRGVLETIGQLHESDSPQWLSLEDQKANLHLTLSHESVLLLQVSW